MKNAPAPIATGLIVVAVVVAGLAAFYMIEFFTKESRARGAVELLVTKHLRDPASAIFGDRMEVYGDGPERVACGTVNARNAYGGYSGSLAFMQWGSRLYIATSEDESSVIGECCDVLYISAGPEMVIDHDSPPSSCQDLPGGAIVTVTAS